MGGMLLPVVRMGNMGAPYKTGLQIYRPGRKGNLSLLSADAGSIMSDGISGQGSGPLAHIVTHNFIDIM
jgi:hypothetical protein